MPKGRALKHTSSVRSFTQAMGLPKDDELIQLIEETQEKTKRRGATEVDVNEPFEPGNAYETARPFITIPVWFRHFVFRLLKPLDFALYVYIFMYADKPGTSFVSMNMMQRHFGYSNRHGFIEAIRRLENLGFLQKKAGRVDRARNDINRNIYQRPSLQQTLIRLLEIGAIDGFLNPTEAYSNKVRRGHVKLRDSRSIPVDIERGLTDLIGEHRVSTYKRARHANKGSVLLDQLREVLKHRIDLASPSKP